MKYTILTTLILTSNAYAQSAETIILEKYNKDSIYYSEKQLKLPTATPKIKSMVQVPGFTSYQVNVNSSGEDILRDAANEPSIAVNPINPNQIAIGWRQFNSVTSDFRQAGRSYSDDGGKTWNYQEVFEPGVFRSDPVLESDADGVFYYQSLKVVGNIFNVDQWKSFDGGKTWQDKTFAYGGDKSWYAIDKTFGSERGNIYNAWNVAANQYGDRTYNNLIYGTSTFSDPVEIPFMPIFGTLDIGLDGSLYIIGIQAYQSISAPMYLIKTDTPYLNLPTFNHQKFIDLGGNMQLGSNINFEGLNGQLYIAVDHSSRSSSGNVYISGSVNPDFTYDQLDVNFIRSTDGGNTFSEPIKINTDDSIGNWQWFGTMSVAPNGRIDIIWNDTRALDGGYGDDQTSRLFYSYSYDGGITFAKDEAISPEFNHLLGYPVQRKMGDYIDMESDNLGAHIAYTATFNGGQDVYYMHAKPSAIEENPDFPALMTNNAWVADGVPRQGILSSILINNGNPDNPLLAFDAIFTAKPDGQPMWLVASGEIPKTGDSFSTPVYMPTGDLADNGTPLLAIGKMTKTRVRDESNELVDGLIQYQFDMTDSAKSYLAEYAAGQFDESYFNSNPFYGIQKNLVFHSILPAQQFREDTCNLNGQVFNSAGEKNEGRLQYTYRTDDILNMFAADFTYKKTVVDGIATIDTDENGLATPFWQVLQSDNDGVLSDHSVTSTVYDPRPAAGFFETAEDQGVDESGTEQITAEGLSVTANKPDGTTENMTILAYNAYCGELIR